MAGPAALAPSHRLDPGPRRPWSRCLALPLCSRPPLHQGTTGQWTPRRPVPRNTGQSQPPGSLEPAETRADVTVPWEIRARSAPAASARAPRHPLTLSLHAWQGRGAAQPWGWWAAAARCRVLRAQSHIPRCPAPAHSQPPAPSPLQEKPHFTPLPASCLPVPVPTLVWSGWGPQQAPVGLRRQVTHTPLPPLSTKAGSPGGAGCCPDSWPSELARQGGWGPCPLPGPWFCLCWCLQAEWGPWQAAGPPGVGSVVPAGAVCTGLDCPSPQGPHCEVKLPLPLCCFIY